MTLSATAAVLVVLQLRSVQASVGILNAVDPGLAPWQALLPAVACPAFVGLSPASRPSVELVAPRATSRLDVALLLCVTVFGGVIVALSSAWTGQPSAGLMGARDLCGFVGIALVLRPWLGWPAWLAPTAFGAFEMLFGRARDGSPVPWAWSIAPPGDRLAAVIALVLLATGLVLTALGRTGRSDDEETEA